MTAEPAAPTLLDTAARIEHRREEQHRRTLLLVIALELFLILIVFAFGFGALHEVRSLIRGQNVELERIEDVIEQNRQAAMRTEAGQDRILLSIGDRLVPKAEVKKLDREVVKLRKEARQLRRAVRQLNRLLRERAAASGGG